jgi:hypothetical protein
MAEKEFNTILENRYGQFYIDFGDFINNNALIRGIVKDIYINFCKFDPITNSLHYNGYSSKFDQLKKGEPAPLYRYEMGPKEGGAIMWKKVKGNEKPG